MNSTTPTTDRQLIANRKTIPATHRSLPPLAWIAVVTLALLISPPARAWWDTQIKAQTPVPLVQEFPAAKCQGATALQEDAQADGGQGGKVVYLKPGSELTFQKDLKRGFYSVWIIARADEKEFHRPAQISRKIPLTGGEVELADPCQTVIATLTLKRPDGQIQKWAMPIVFDTQYAVVSKLYFPLHSAGPCELSVGFDGRSETGLLVDRLELRDVLGNCARQAAKTQRTLKTDAELAALREPIAAAAAAKKAAAKNPKPPVVPSPEQQRAATEALWNTIPALNIMNADPTFKGWATAEYKLFGAAGLYEKTGAKDQGWQAAILLCAYAEKFPGLDHAFQASEPTSNFGTRKLSWGSQDGKILYSGWAGSAIQKIATTYDQLFDFIKDNQELADYISTKIPWVKKPQDVIELLDSNLLQHGVDCLNRRVIRDDVAAALLPLVQGANEVSRQMLAGGLFSKTHFDMTDAGGLEDQAFSAFNRGGVHYIGSMGYVSDALTDILEYLNKYHQLGGDPRFDLSDPERYPNLKEARLTKQGLYAAGGFPIIVGDSMDLRRNRAKQDPAFGAIPEFPSRVVEGFGEVVLEDGQGLTNPLLKRAVAIHTGIGRGHSHQDTLNFELFAHGCRLAPDLGGRHEGALSAQPNMRNSCMHNLVEVDQKNFENDATGSTTSGSGWTTSFSPQPGVQYTANSGRATSHPTVQLYQRSTAMIDGDVTETNADVYLFDVFRVQGGKVHTYCFHGAPDFWADASGTSVVSKLKTNFKLKPAGPAAQEYMHRRPADSLQEAEAPAILEASWPLGQSYQKQYQESFYQADQPVGVTLTLFGHAGELVMVGGATSKAYPVDMPYLHVQGRQENEGRASVYPALYEAHAGAPFLSDKRLLTMKPASPDAKAGVAVAVKVGTNRRDVLYSSLQPDQPVEIEDGTQVAGEFGFVSEDAAGLRMLHLVGGTKLTRGDIGVTCDRAAYSARIETVDYLHRSLTLSAEFPARLLDRQLGLFGNDRHWAEFQLDKVADRNASVVYTPKYYQSKIEFVDEAKSQVTTELEPAVYGCDPQFCNGTTVSNDRGDKFWKVTFNPSERWMYLGWPGCRLSYPTAVTEADLKDAQGDSQWTLKLFGNGSKEKAEEKARTAQAEKLAPTNNPVTGAVPAPTKPAATPQPGLESRDQVILDLQITRVDPENHLIYFKMPDNPDYQTGGWQFANRILQNAAGTKKWLASYPGTVNTWTLEGSVKPTKKDLNPDGTGHLNAYHFGPADTLTVKTFVYLKRLEKGLYQLKANVPCQVTLPDAGSCEISGDGQEYHSLPAHKLAKGLTIPFTAQDLGTGTVWIRTHL